jgi:hypothetical protein
MKLRAYKIGNVTYFCNELQIEEAGSLEMAAYKIAGFETAKKLKPKPAKVEIMEDDKIQPLD